VAKELDDSHASRRQADILTGADLLKPREKLRLFGTICSGRAFSGQEKLEDHMEQTTGVVSAERIEPTTSGVSWAAVIAGAAASCALTLLLLSFGAGMGFAVVSPWGGRGVSLSTFEIGTGLYFIVMAMISSAVGGYLAGRLRTKWTGIQT